MLTFCNQTILCALSTCKDCVLAYQAQASRVVPRTREIRLRRLMLGVRRVCCSSSFVIGDVLCRDSLRAHPSNISPGAHMAASHTAR